MEQKKKALGRGLEQLFSSEVLDFDTFEDNIMESAKESDIVQIPVNDIRPNPYQPRRSFDQESLDELATSIRNYGVFQPIIVKKSIKGYDLVAGERRLRASKLAGLDTNSLSVHKLRHTAATLMYQYGNVDIRALQELLGHQSISTTEIYTHVSNEQVRNAVEANPLSDPRNL